MKTIIAGSRTIVKADPVLRAISRSDISITSIVSGGARGVDTVAIYSAGVLDLPYPDIYYADWKRDVGYDPQAGHKRNALMAENAEALIAIWDGRSPGTRNMIKEARQRNLKTVVFYVDPVTGEFKERT